MKLHVCLNWSRKFFLNIFTVWPEEKTPDNLSKFKTAIRKNKITSVPKYYFYGPRKLNIILTQLRCSASFLNSDLYKINIVDSPACACGAPCEDLFHFFFVCDRYVNFRRELLSHLEWVPQNINVNVKLLTRRK